MSGVQKVTVTDDDDGVRLDRWFKRHFPDLTFGRLQKLMRKGDVRLDGKRVKDSAKRLEAGQVVRVPPLGEAPQTDSEPGAAKVRPPVSHKDAIMIQACVLYKDDDILVINKPAGLAVQGGSNTLRHVDGMLDALQFDKPERPRLVHRLDKDTSGVLLLARSAKSAADLTAAFREKEMRKAYWAMVVGVPELARGRISLPISKLPGRSGEKMQADPENGKSAVSLYHTIETAGRRAAWLELEPLTGRTHQLRAHCVLALDTPILGDGKYGGEEAFLEGAEISK